MRSRGVGFSVVSKTETESGKKGRERDTRGRERQFLADREKDGWDPKDRHTKRERREGSGSHFYSMYGQSS